MAGVQSGGINHTIRRQGNEGILPSKKPSVFPNGRLVIRQRRWMATLTRSCPDRSRWLTACVRPASRIIPRTASPWLAPCSTASSPPGFRCRGAPEITARK